MLNQAFNSVCTDKVMSEKQFMLLKEENSTVVFSTVSYLIKSESKSDNLLLQTLSA